MPNKKWYLLVDDDTYVVQPSMNLLLERLNPKQNYYIGNPVGNWLCRFAHGGSSVIISQAAMRRMFSPRYKKVIAESNRESLTETWGDRLLASTFIRLGVYLDENFRNLFNGERPVVSKLREDRFCAPVISFHGHSQPEDMHQTGETFRKIQSIVRWMDIWDMNGLPPPKHYAKDPLRRDWDHVGRLDEWTWTTTDQKNAHECHDACKGMPHGQCLAWTWEEKEGKCHRSPWVIVGSAAEGKVTGVNAERMSELMAECKTRK
jgi:hypothetical protein